jgi:hypothetical protein
MKLTITRKTWRRGGLKYYKEFGGIELLNSKGQQCCLGFLCEELGVERNHLLGYGYPSAVARRFPEDAEKLIQAGLVIKDENGDFNSSDFTTKAIMINDDRTECYPFYSQEREQQIIDLFKTKDIEVEFID